MSSAPHDDSSVAIIGMAGRFPGAADLDAFWRLIVEGRDAITRFDEDEEPLADAGAGAEHYVRARGVLDGIEAFDAPFFDVTPGEAAQLDPQHRVWLEVAWEALEAAGYAHDRHGLVVSVYAGSYPGTYLFHNLLPDRAALEEYVRMRRARSLGLLVQNDPGFLPTRTAYKLDLRGPAVNVQTACSTSLAAVAMAVQGLLHHEADMALAGGVCVAVPQRTGYFYQEGAIHSRDGTCRPYDAAACGTVFGNGAGAVVLKRLPDARRDGDPILAVVRGAAVNNDGREKVSFFAPSVKGQAEVVATAQVLAGVEPGTIGYVEGHGTATPMGDPIEVEALKLAFRHPSVRPGSCCLGSVKGNIGHLDAAAGVAGLIRAVLALRHRQLPATARFDRPNPELRLEGSAFFVSPRTIPWPAADHPRRAGVSSFGIGGTNVHVVLEEAPPPPPRPCRADARQETVLLLSARSRPALDAATERLAAWADAACAEGLAPRPLPEVALALDRRRRRFGHRRAVRVDGWADAVAALRDPSRWDTDLAVDGRPRLVMSFPGQGSLQPGALSGLLAEEEGLAGCFEPLARAASELAGFDLLAWARDPSADAAPLRRDNAKAQLAIFCVDVALARWLEARGVRADGFLGHSLGEWVAAHLAGVLGTEDALRAVHRRGALMQGTGPGAALAVRCAEAEATAFLSDGVALACVNGPRLCLLSGRPEAIAACAERLAAAGVAARPLPIDVAVHSPFMDPVVEALRAELPRLAWRAPDRPILSTVSGQWMEPAAAGRPDYWAAQPRQTVRFDAAAATLFEAPCTLALEVGMGDALTTLVRARLRDAGSQRALALLGRPRDDGGWAPRRLRRALGELWAAGLDVDLVGRVEAGPQAPVLPTYAFQRQVHWKQAPAPVRPAGSPEQDGAGAPPAAVAAPAPSELDVRGLMLDQLAELSGLDARQLDPEASFSSLGFDSLLLVQFAERIAGPLGRPVEIRTLAEFDSVAKLAVALAPRPAPRAAAAAAAPGPEAAAPAGAGFRGLFTLRKGDGRLPMLLIHGDNGNYLLPPWLPEDQPVYGYAHQGSHGERVLHRTVEALARRCTEEWVAAGLEGPCIVAGHSFGGLVAHQVAHLLGGLGHRVELLVLVDALHPRCFNPSPGPSLRWLYRAARNAAERAVTRGRIARLERCLRRGERIPVARRTEYILSVYDLAVPAYAPPFVDVDTLFFRATASAWSIPRGWREEEFRSLQVLEVKGNHLSIIRSAEDFAVIGEAIGARVARLRQALPGRRQAGG